MELNQKLIQQLLSLINALSAAEAEIAKKHLIAYAKKSTKEDQKMFQLFSYLADKDKIEFNDLKIKVSGDVSDESFIRLLRRTHARVKESLIMDVNITREGVYSDVFLKQFQLKKMLMQGHILQGRALAESALNVYNNIISTAKKYELYDELIEAIILKQSLIANMRGTKTFKRLNADLKFAERCRNYLRDTKIIYVTYSVGLRTNSLTKSQKATLSKEIEKIQYYHEETKSVNIYTQLLLIQMELYSLEGKVKEEIEVGKTLLKTLKFNKAVYSKPRIGFVYANITDCELSVLQFKKSLQLAREAESWANKYSINHIIAKIYQNESYFFLNKFSDSMNAIEETLAFSVLQKYPYHYARLHFMKSMNLFALKDFKSAVGLLANLSEIEKDKEGWNLWIRIMRILCSIELSKLNLFDYDLDSLRKHIGRVEKGSVSIRSRDRLIFKILNELSRNNLDFEETSMKRAKELELLKSVDKEYSWNIDSPEKVLFHDWFDSKLNEVEYKPNFERYS